MAEFQAVILAGGRPSSLYPLTEDLPTCLLPVVNRPLLSYQLDLLEDCKFSDVIIACDQSVVSKVQDYVNQRSKPAEASADNEQKTSDGITCKVVGVKEDGGTAGALREIRHMLKNDLIVLSGDLIAERALFHLADLHRVKESSVTIMLKAEEGDPRTGKGPKIHGFWGLSSDGRVVYSHPKVEASKTADEPTIAIPKYLLRNCPGVSLRADLRDAHTYIFSNWVLDVLDEYPEFKSVEKDLVPFLIRHQYRMDEELSQELYQRVLGQVSGDAARSGSVTGRATSKDAIQCHALLVPPSGLYMARVTSLASYLNVNRDLRSKKPNTYTPWDRPTGVKTKFKDCVVGENVDFGNKVALKGSVVGSNCKIGTKTKVNNSVIHDDVVIGENCIIQNCVISSKAVIESDCNLNECHLGPEALVAADSRLKDEQVSGTGIGLGLQPSSLSDVYGGDGGGAGGGVEIIFSNAAP